MPFIRVGKAEGSEPDVLDRAMGLAHQQFAHLSGNAQAGPAASLIRDFSEIAKAGGSLEAQAAGCFIRGLASYIRDEQLDAIRVTVAPRVAEIVARTRATPQLGSPLATSVRRRRKAIAAAGDQDSRLVLRCLAVREANRLARRPELDDSDLEMHIAVETVLATYPGGGMPGELAEIARVHPGVAIRRPLRPCDPPSAGFGYFSGDHLASWLRWHEDAGDLLVDLSESASHRIDGDALEELLNQLDSLELRYRQGKVSEEHARAQAVRLDPWDFVWIGTFDELRAGTTEMGIDVREWYWDADHLRDTCEDGTDPISDELLEDFIRTIDSYGQM